METLLYTVYTYVGVLVPFSPLYMYSFFPENVVVFLIGLNIVMFFVGRLKYYCDVFVVGKGLLLLLAQRIVDKYLAKKCNALSLSLSLSWLYNGVSLMLFLIQFLSIYTCSLNELEKTKTNPKK